MTQHTDASPHPSLNAQRSAQLPAQLTVLLSATRRGARLARLLTVAELSARGLPSENAALVVAELAANAVLHGLVPGRSFRLTLRTDERHLRIEVTDARGETEPEQQPQPPDAEAESGRGLLLVEALATRWGVHAGPTPCKTVWAELPLSDEALAEQAQERS